ncbi:DUF1697 domain-containing protein [Arenimonas composti]|uniref:DUF1697 domain-containing protein n=1 Tax=Arenimonas composti TR7-09 = DSM 18010 TaxID=1121013 RepID=A0A091BCR6_9GAMM|nr:DUF1697 domain-containing protein [Arenimonas composti]KFN49521.1 hypothetical protein P873_10230 [Arenimonas composti TR7-09 = DSM 18010]
MKRYVAFLRGVSPMNCRMPALRQAFEAAGFGDVRTLLSSGNVAFSARSASIVKLQQACEATMAEHLGRCFQAFVRPSEHLQALLARDPFAAFPLPADAKKVITFLHRAPATTPELPLRQGQAAILGIAGTEVFSAYVPDERGPVFMAQLEKTFGKDITTRTLDTVRKCAAA